MIVKIGYLVDGFRYTSVATLLFGLLTLLKSESSFDGQITLYTTITLILGILSLLLYIANIVVLTIFANVVG